MQLLPEPASSEQFAVLADEAHPADEVTALFAILRAEVRIRRALVARPAANRRLVIEVELVADSAFAFLDRFATRPFLAAHHAIRCTAPFLEPPEALAVSTLALMQRLASIAVPHVLRLHDLDVDEAIIAEERRRLDEQLDLRPMPDSMLGDLAIDAASPLTTLEIPTLIPLVGA